jgi:multiple sugar transport system permease protein
VVIRVLPIFVAVAAGGLARGRRLRRRDLVEQQRVLGPLLIAPAVIFVVVVVGVPLIWAIYLSLTDATGGSLSGKFVGLENFTDAWRDQNFRNALENTLIITFASQVLVVVGAAVVSHYLVRDFRGKWLVRLLVILPWAAPVALVTIAWLWILDSLLSVLSWTLGKMHLLGAVCGAFGVHGCSAANPPPWLGHPNLAMFSIIVVQAWRILPFAVIIFVAGRASIPSEVDDAARIDGASALKKLWYVDLPLQLPIALVAVLFGIVFTAADFAVVWVLTRGGPFNSTQVLTTWSESIGIESTRVGAGAAISLYLFPLLLAVTILMLFFARRAQVS